MYELSAEFESSVGLEEENRVEAGAQCAAAAEHSEGAECMVGRGGVAWSYKSIL